MTVDAHGLTPRGVLCNAGAGAAAGTWFSPALCFCFSASLEISYKTKFFFFFEKIASCSNLRLKVFQFVGCSCINLTNMMNIMVLDVGIGCRGFSCDVCLSFRCYQDQVSSARAAQAR